MKLPRTLICQTNPTPGDFTGNYSQIIQGNVLAGQNDVDLVVFPELAIPGYLCKDMMFRKGFVEQNLKFLHFIADASKHSDHHIIVGYIDHNHSGYGKPFRNMAAVIQGGAILATYQKHLLPFYDVFDEGRYFQPGTELTVIEIDGMKWGVCICEDVWNDKNSDDYNYKDNPLEQYRDIGVNNIISINSSPYVQGKPEKRRKMVRDSSLKEPEGIIIYGNQIGGQDELVFDGNSFVANQGMLMTYKKLGNHLLFDNSWNSPPVASPEDSVYDMLKMGLRDYVSKSGFKSVVVGSSGGIDSALVIALACDALGADNVHAIRMPSSISSEHSKNDASLLHDRLGCHDYLVPFEHSDIVRHILGRLGNNPFFAGEPKPIANENIQARMRGMILMYFSNAFGSLLLSTGNKTELALGYCTLYGDMNGGFCPINDLYKMEVYRLAKEYNDRAGKEVIPNNILTKAPSAELAPGQTDEASLLPYPILDAIVKAYVEDYVGDFKGFEKYCVIRPWMKDVREWGSGVDAPTQYDRMIKLINNNEFKRRQAAPGIKVTPVAFGIGRRLPIVKG